LTRNYVVTLMAILIFYKAVNFLIHISIWLRRRDLTWLTNCIEIHSCGIEVPEAVHSSNVVHCEVLCQAGFCKNHTKLNQKLVVLLLPPGLSFNNNPLLMLFLFGGYSSFAVGCVASVSEARATTIFRFKVRRWSWSVRITKGKGSLCPVRTLALHW